MKIFTLSGQIKAYYHKTWEIVKIINDKCELIITMNVTRSLAKSICDKEMTKIYFVSSSKDLRDICKEVYPIGTSHMKIYVTKEKVYISTANLSLSNWDEITIEFERTEEWNRILEGIEKSLQIKNDFIRAFH